MAEGDEVGVGNENRCGAVVAAVDVDAVTAVAVAAVGEDVVGVDILILDNLTTAAEEGGRGVNEDLPPTPLIGKALPCPNPCP